jgi:hypothetical protein
MHGITHRAGSRLCAISAGQLRYGVVHNRMRLEWSRAMARPRSGNSGATSNRTRFLNTQGGVIGMRSLPTPIVSRPNDQVSAASRDGSA